MDFELSAELFWVVDFELGAGRLLGCGFGSLNLVIATKTAGLEVRRFLLGWLGIVGLWGEMLVLGLIED